MAVVRILIGSIVGGIVQFLIGAIAWLGLGDLAYRSLPDAAAADLQTAMARTLTATGTGTYFIPSPESAGTTALFGRGPVGLVFFNTSGFPVMDPGALLTGLVLSGVMLFLVGTALSLVDDTAARFKVAGLFAVAMILYFVLSLPVYNFYLPWGWWIFLAVEELVAFGAAAYVLIRWFMPVRAAAPTV
jgi:hypothetical protein